ncbi:MAG TPA: hypothetical protein VGX37_08635 [Allosphingosinicella sp.]|jgi:hypothetical protein|nr:hypothetical protein [Allosphingosinicella sp.]
MVGLLLRFCCAVLLAAVAGCAAVQSTSDVAVGYNRAFAESRDEVLLLNILRSAAREPLQFSLMGNVQGQVGNTSSIEIPFVNVIAGGRDIISPRLTIGDAVNPNVTIVPLGAREFATQILTPVSAEQIRLFLHSGWDAEFLLPLLVGGVVCPDGRLLLNSGEYEEDGSTAVNDAFVDFFRRSAPQFQITSEPTPGSPQTFTVADDRAIALLRDGLGPNYIVGTVEDAEPGTKRITIRPSQRTIISGLQVEGLCAAVRSGQHARPSIASVELSASRGRVVLRSVETIIYYLGESHRVRVRSGTLNRRGLVYYSGSGRLLTLFKAEEGPSPVAAVATRFHGTGYFIPRIDLHQGEAEDRTLKTLSFLDELIALQTNENTIRSAQPIVAITSQ